VIDARRADFQATKFKAAPDLALYERSCAFAAADLTRRAREPDVHPDLVARAVATMHPSRRRARRFAEGSRWGG
jgi:hypothetical protein